MIKLPLNGEWRQLNNSDKIGSLAYSKNLNFDKKGYWKLSPRSVNIFDDVENLSNSSDTDFNIPTAFGRIANGEFRIATTDEPFDLSMTSITKSMSEDSGSNNPDLNFMSHGCWFKNKFHESTDTAVRYKDSTNTWSTNVITGLTSGKRHYMAVFMSRVQLCITNGNVVKQYSESGGVYTNTVDLTIPDDFEITGIAYNNSRMAVITRLGSDSVGQNTEARFYLWDGASTGAIADCGVGADSILVVKPYKSSFVIVTSSGQILYWNGGGFEELASFPFYFEDFRGSDLSYSSYGDSVVIDGNIILINIGFNLNGISPKGENYLQGNPSGVWCYDPEVGLYHKFSPSLSRAYTHLINPASNVDLVTGIITTSSTIPSTGNPLIIPQQSLGGFTVNKVYYVIKLSSTTFRIAETKEDAISGNYLVPTSAPENTYIWMYDIIDYGIAYYTTSGAIDFTGGNTSSYRDVIFGNRLINTDMSSVVVLNTCVPFLKNIGYGVTPKFFLDSVKEKMKKIVIKHKPLTEGDSITVKIKDKEYYGLPTSTPDNNSNSITWTSAKGGYTSINLSEAKSAFDRGEELELELTAGVGAGQLLKITSIAEEDGVYAITTKEEVVGYSSLKKSYFVIDNWKEYDSVNSETQKEGIFSVTVGTSGKAIQAKIVVEGYNVTIEDILFYNEPHINQ